MMTIAEQMAGMTRKQQRRYLARLLKERPVGEQAVSAERGGIAQTPEAMYEAVRGLRDWYRGECQCASCLAKHPTSEQRLIDRDGKHIRKTFTGRRVPHVATMLVVRKAWDADKQEVTRTVVGTIEYGDYLDGRVMSNEAEEIAAMTEPPRVVTGESVSGVGAARRNIIADAGLHRQRTRRVSVVTLRGHCAICDEPKEPGKSYCMACRVLLRTDGGEAALVERMEAGKKRRAAR